jgi:lysophospholipase L1-like esterase
MEFMSTAANQPAKPRSIHRRHVIIMLVVGAVLVGGAFFVKHYYLRLPAMGEGPAGPTVPREPFATAWSQRPVLVVGLGDSIPVGEGAGEGYGFFARMIANPPDEFPEMQGLCLKAVLPNLEVKNLAVSDTTSDQHEQNQLPQIQVQPRDVLGVVVLSSGGNDLLHYYGFAKPRPSAMYGATFEQATPWTDAYEQRLDAMLTQIESCFPGGCHILVANIYDPTDGTGPISVPRAPQWPDATRILTRYNEVIARCVARHPSAHLVDIHSLFMGHGFRCDHFWASCYRPDDPHFWYYENIEDPNPRGHDAIRRAILLEVAKAFGKLE